MSFAEAAFGELVVLAVGGAAALDALNPAGAANLAGKNMHNEPPQLVFACAEA